MLVYRRDYCHEETLVRFLKLYLKSSESSLVGNNLFFPPRFLTINKLHRISHFYIQK